MVLSVRIKSKQQNGKHSA